MSNRQTTELAIELAMASGHVPNLIGDTGVGKSDLIEKLAIKTGRKLILLNLGTQEPSDLIGMPSSRNGRTHWDLPCWWPTEEDNHCIIFIDEINRAKKDVINAIFPMILTKTLHVEHSLPSDTWICSAMNPDTEDFGLVFSFDDAAFTSRFIHIPVNGTFQSWKEWMGENKPGDFRQYFSIIERNTSHLMPDMKPTEINFQIKPKWRSWTKFIDIVEYCKKHNISNAENALLIISRGLLGQETTAVLAMHLEALLLGNNSDSLTTFLNTEITDNNAISLSETFMSMLATNVAIAEPKTVDWACKFGRQHPSLMRKILFTAASSSMDPFYSYQEFLDMISFLSKQ